MRSSNPPLKVFLDANVFVNYLKGESVSTRLFSPDLRERVRYAVNSIVLQELLAIPEVKADPNLISELEKRLEVLPLDIAMTERWIRRASTLRNQLVHSNDLLILGSAASCDFLVTFDRDLLRFAKTDQKPKVVSPSEFLSSLEGA